MKTALRDSATIQQLRDRLGFQKGVKFRRGDKVRKSKGSSWSGTIVGEYSTTLTPEGYAVESFAERGSVQIYPAAALELIASLPS